MLLLARFRPEVIVRFVALVMLLAMFVAVDELEVVLLPAISRRMSP